MPAAQPSPWRIAGHTARLDAPPFTLVVNLRDPAAGVEILLTDSHTASGIRLFAIDIPIPVDDSGLEFFARGNDLVATYPETVERPLRAQAYWRWLPNLALSAGSASTPAIFALELILSVQTSLLDSNPAQFVRSAAPMDTASQLLDPSAARWLDRTPQTTAAIILDSTGGTGCFAFRLNSGRGTYLEMVHPADFHRATLERSSRHPPDFQLTHQLFAQRLEKGVILRSRIRGLLTTVSDPAMLAAAYREFAASEPPLTA